jgi:hypothetical protein
MFTIVETPSFLADAKNAGLSDVERIEIVDFIAANPMAGDEIAGSGGARKCRFAGRGKGKSGGYRVVTFYSGETMPVFLLNIFAKGDRTNISKAETNALRAILGALANTYRARRKRQ